jgi:hypothetical protein
MGRQTANYDQRRQPLNNKERTQNMISTLETTGSLNRDPLTAEHGASTVSDRYGFVSTRTLLDNLQAEGFTPRDIQIARVNKTERQGFQKHIIRLKHDSLMPSIGNDHQPEIVLVNSHDARSSLKLALGIIRFVCMNGIISGEMAFSTRFIHRDITTDRVNEAAIGLTKMVPQLQARIAGMKERVLSEPEVGKFIRDAAALRWDDERKINEVTWALGRKRRYEDGTNNLWQVFNRVQENIIRGGYRVRKITSAAKDVEINRDLWNLAAGFLN